MNRHKDTEPKLVFTGQSWEAELLKNILEKEGISAYLNNEATGNMFPFLTTPGMGAVKLVVTKEDYEKAMELVREFEEGRFE